MVLRAPPDGPAMQATGQSPSCSLVEAHLHFPWQALARHKPWCCKPEQIGATFTLAYSTLCDVGRLVTSTVHSNIVGGIRGAILLLRRYRYRTLSESTSLEANERAKTSVYYSNNRRVLLGLTKLQVSVAICLGLNFTAKSILLRACIGVFDQGFELENWGSRCLFSPCPDPERTRTAAFT
jgi:hypothetical protein